MRPRAVLLAVLFALATVSVHSLSRCTNTVWDCYGVCGDGTYPVSSPKGLQCMKMCNLCTDGSYPTCAEGYYDPGNDTCMPCSWRCHDVTNCSSEVTCPQGCTSGLYGLHCTLTCPSGCAGSCERWTGLCTEGCERGKWGDRCGESCSYKCGIEGCLQESGRCRGCGRSVWWGDFCEKLCYYPCQDNVCDQHGFCPKQCYESKWGRSCSSYCGSRCSNCDSMTGKCTVRCNNEFSNDFCLQECPNGTWGEACDKTCSSNCPGSCQQLTGECAGICYVDRWSSNCSSGCPSGCKGGVCHSETAQCMDCVDGYWGEFCNVTCPLGCSRCPQLWSGCTECKIGYFVDNKNCMACPPNCDGSCDRQTGECPGCTRGFYGARCNYTCSSGCKTQYSFHSTPFCDKNTGFCTNGCLSTKYGDSCNNTCSSNCARAGSDSQICLRIGGNCSQGCIRNFWGPTCASSCPANCLNDACLQSSGHCDLGCESGWQGERCDKECYEGCFKCLQLRPGCTECKTGYFLDNTNCTACLPNCDGTCNRQTGECPRCIRGFYGAQCINTCSSGCKTEPSYYSAPLCVKDSGTCTHGCLSTKYGDFCNNSCSSNCEASKCTGKGSSLRCTDGCVDGFKGDYCQSPCPSSCISCNEWKCLSCKGELWGDSCQTPCASGCPGDCDVDNGLCLSDCVSGYYDSKCDKTCNSNCARTTPNSQICRRYGGECSQGCVRGYYGSSCDYNCSNLCSQDNPDSQICLRYGGDCSQGCVRGYYGSSCDLKCSSNCSQDDPDSPICSRHNGRCSQGCVRGIWGSVCSLQCSSYCTQSDLDQVCSQDSGYCLQGCPVGRYGSTCDAFCSAHCLNETCHQSTGHCDLGCDPGWRGEYCGKVCREGSYGAGCEKNCSHTCQEGIPLCFHVTGACLHGCKHGWHGLTCSHSVGVPVWVLGVSLVPAVLVTVLLSCLAYRFLSCCLRRGKANQSENTYEVIWTRDTNQAPAPAGSPDEGASAGTTNPGNNNQGDYDFLNFDLKDAAATEEVVPAQEAEQTQEKERLRSSMQRCQSSDRYSKVRSRVKSHAETFAQSAPLPCTSRPEAGDKDARGVYLSPTYKHDLTSTAGPGAAANAISGHKHESRDREVKATSDQGDPQPMDKEEESPYQNFAPRDTRR